MSELTCATVIGQLLELGTGKMPTPVYCKRPLERAFGYPVAFCPTCLRTHKLTDAARVQGGQP